MSPKPSGMHPVISRTFAIPASTTSISLCRKISRSPSEKERGWLSPQTFSICRIIPNLPSPMPIPPLGTSPVSPARRWTTAPCSSACTYISEPFASGLRRQTRMLSLCVGVCPRSDASASYRPCHPKNHRICCPPWHFCMLPVHCSQTSPIATPKQSTPESARRGECSRRPPLYGGLGRNKF